MASNDTRISRPDNNEDFIISDREKDILSYAVLFGVTKYVAVERLCVKEYTDGRGKITDNGRQYAKKIFGNEEARKYVEAMRDKVAKFTNGTYTATPIDNDELEISEERKGEALKALFNNALALVENGKSVDADTLKVVSEIYKKIGLLKEDEEVQEKPRRYLPERCSMCKYKQFIEENVRLGKIGVKNK